MRMLACIAVVCAAGALAAGCMEKETRSVLYLQPDGSVVWTIFESNVRSDADTAEERSREEADYRATMLSNPTPLAALLGSLGGRQASRTVLKDTVPFEVHTSASFDRVDALFERICLAAGCVCQASTRTEGDLTILTVETLAETDGPGEPALADALTNLKLVLVEGRFVGGSGFTVVDGRTAKLDNDADDHEGATWTLTWVGGPPSP